MTIDNNCDLSGIFEVSTEHNITAKVSRQISFLHIASLFSVEVKFFWKTGTAEEKYIYLRKFYRKPYNPLRFFCEDILYFVLTGENEHKQNLSKLCRTCGKFISCDIYTFFFYYKKHTFWLQAGVS